MYDIKQKKLCTGFLVDVALFCYRLVKMAINSVDKGVFRLILIIVHVIKRGSLGQVSIELSENSSVPDDFHFTRSRSEMICSYALLFGRFPHSIIQILLFDYPPWAGSRSRGQHKECLVRSSSWHVLVAFTTLFVCPSTSSSMKSKLKTIRRPRWSR